MFSAPVQIQELQRVRGHLRPAERGRGEPRVQAPDRAADRAARAPGVSVVPLLAGAGGEAGGAHLRDEDLRPQAGHPHRVGQQLVSGGSSPLLFV